MSVTHRAVLVALVGRFEATSDPQPPAAVARELGVSTTAVEGILTSLAGYELVKATGDGYRPTVTGRELLELDAWDGDWVVIDVQDE